MLFFVTIHVCLNGRYYYMVTLAVMLWHVNSATALKCNGYGMESLLAQHLDKGSVPWRGGPGM